jgi:hypothetical protein
MGLLHIHLDWRLVSVLHYLPPIVLFGVWASSARCFPTSFSTIPDCLCTNRSNPLLIFALSSPMLEACRVFRGPGTSTRLGDQIATFP